MAPLNPSILSFLLGPGVPLVWEDGDPGSLAAEINNNLLLFLHTICFFFVVRHEQPAIGSKEPLGNGG